MSAPGNNQLAKALQGGVPFVEDPWTALGAQVSLTADEVLAQLQSWKEGGELREISAVLEGAAFGYDSALVAGTVPAERLEEVAGIVGAHPTVTHNYERLHAFNLWFTIAAPRDMGLLPTLRILARQAGVDAFFPMERTHTFKIGVAFDLESRTNETGKGALSDIKPVEVGPRERVLFRALQTPLPLTPRPFAALTQTLGLDEAELLAFAREHQGHALRRYVGTFRHRKLGVKGNGMAVWNVPEERIASVGEQLAAAPEVSHCYARNRIPGFPFALYSMIHGPDNDAVSVVAARLAAEVGVADYAVLFSAREFKKARLRYFLPELDTWWNAHRELAAA
ncbi:MAG: hypothetical protein IT382_05785 [Deltaproteobacteria bacterium]|nr:hypothetical protein [Deltaproteobacteria bacterium]